MKVTLEGRVCSIVLCFTITRLPGSFLFHCKAGIGFYLNCGVFHLLSTVESLEKCRQKWNHVLVQRLNATVCAVLCLRMYKWSQWEWKGQETTRLLVSPAQKTGHHWEGEHGASAWCEEYELCLQSSTSQGSLCRRWRSKQFVCVCVCVYRSIDTQET